MREVLLNSEFRPHRFVQNVNRFAQKCISVLKAAKSDTERFAALLLATQVVHSNEMDGHGRRQLFDAIGFKFVNKIIEHQKCTERLSCSSLQVVSFSDSCLFFFRRRTLCTP